MRVRIAGLDWGHPIGLAAGFDKNAIAVEGCFALGFAAVEVGALTPKPQKGNPKPRLFRLDADRAIVNRMGFNNLGVEEAASRLARLAQRPGPIGANIGPNKDSADPLRDYVACFEALIGLVDYVSVNVSSPNTAGLRAWQSKDGLDAIAGALARARDAAAAKPAIFFKIAPDLDEEAMAMVADFAARAPIDGLILTNTTIERPKSLKSDGRFEQGGLSGRPLRDRAVAMVRFMRRRLGGAKALIGVGGVETSDDVYRRLRAGADAVQLYTSLIYEGPYLPRRLARELDTRLAREGVDALDQIVGVDA